MQGAHGTEVQAAGSMMLRPGNECPDGLHKIFEENQCAEAAREIFGPAALIRGTETSEFWPAGCYHCVQIPEECDVCKPCFMPSACTHYCLQEGTWMNGHPTGQAFEGARVYCRNVTLQALMRAEEEAARLAAVASPWRELPSIH